MSSKASSSSTSSGSVVALSTFNPGAERRSPPEAFRGSSGGNGPVVKFGGETILQ